MHLYLDEAAPSLCHLFVALSTLSYVLQGGICRNAFFLGQFPCCWGMALLDDDPTCQEWRAWSEGISGSSGAYVVEYFFYVGFSVAFAGLAALLVSILAPQAANTGLYGRVVVSLVRIGTVIT